MPDIEILVNPSPRGLSESIRRTAEAALRAGGRKSGRLEIAVVGGAEMRRQHAAWMGDSSETDVLTFDLREDGRSPRVDGQLIVCSAVARREARRRGADWRSELLLYVVHGCLHLCGYDDHRPTDAARMHRLEDRILTRLGRGPVFGSGPAKPATLRRARHR